MVDRQGREQSISAPPRSYVYERLSPDGTRRRWISGRPTTSGSGIKEVRQEGEAPPVPQLIVVQNWLEELKRLAPTN
jgi:hypothetical protein